LTSLACISRPSTLTVSPATSGAVAADTIVQYDIAARNNDVGLCPDKQYEAFFTQTEPGIEVDFSSSSFQSVSHGSTAHFAVNVSGSDEADPGVHSLPFLVDTLGGKSKFEQLSGALSFELAPPTGCFVTTRRELMITGTSVVDDPIRTAGSVNPGGDFGGIGTAGSSGDIGAAGAVDVSGFAGGGPTGSGGSFGSGGASSGGGGGPGISGPAGVWSFGYLMRQMAPTPEAAPAMTLKLLQHWLSDQVVNGFTVQARPAMQQQLIDIWPRTANGELDLDQSPLTLQAIVNRIDTRNLAENSAGEGRFVFGVNGPNF